MSLTSGCLAQDRQKAHKKELFSKEKLSHKSKRIPFNSKGDSYHVWHILQFGVNDFNLGTASHS
jgi:hypothetical protein